MIVNPVLWYYWVTIRLLRTRKIEHKLFSVYISKFLLIIEIKWHFDGIKFLSIILTPCLENQFSYYCVYKYNLNQIRSISFTEVDFKMWNGRTSSASHPCCTGGQPCKKLTGGRFKNAYELLNLRALKISMLYKNHISQCMDKIFCVEFQRVPLKFHTKYLIHTLKDADFIHRWRFKSS